MSVRTLRFGAALLVAALGAHCSTERGEPRQPPGHQRMLALLQETAEQASRESLFLGTRPLEDAETKLATLPAGGAADPRRWAYNIEAARNAMRLGEVDRGIEYYLTAEREMERLGGQIAPTDVLTTIYELGVAHLRLGETQNCVARNNPASCILPIWPEGVFQVTAGEETGIRYLERVLELADPSSLIHLRARWLLNIAHMQLGRHPDGVPASYRIPPEVFVSDEAFPRFHDIAARLGVNSFDLSGGAIADDFNGDGFLDLMMSTSNASGQMRYFRNNGDGTFTERTREAGLRGLIGGLNMVQADYDNDGDIDVLVLRGAWWRQNGRHPNSLLRNNGDETFTDVTFEAGIGEHHYPTQTASWGDYDNDGDLDLFVGNEYSEEQPSPAQLFRNNGDGTFTDVAEQAGVLNHGFSKSVIWGDFDNDRFVDLCIGNLGRQNRLYHNNGDGTFTDVADRAGVTLPIAGFAVWFWDINNDGALDLFAASYGGPRLSPDVAAVAAGYLGLPHDHELARLYLGDGRGGFREVGAQYGLGRMTFPMGSNFGDLDNDGYPDFYLGTGYPVYEAQMPNVMFHNLRGQGFADVTFAGGFGTLARGHAVVFADLDHDGDQDVYEQLGGAYRGAVYYNALYENPGFGNHWLKLKLVGRRSNRSGVGARVRADVVEPGGPRTIYKHVNSGGTFGCNPLRIELGLGQAERIERLEIFWPTSGETQQFLDVEPDQLLEITEGETSYRRLPLTRISFAS